tara:strand:+ start:13144 stop:13770 length:627 start_codon:yes stop_codon:yes gene_type:complete
MIFFVEKILNSPIESNSFLIYTNENKSCVIVDPGTENCKSLFEFIKKKQLEPEYIFLTHEHFDHIWGVNKLKNTYNDVKIIASRECSLNIVNKKKNLSVFYNQVGFDCYPADILIEDIGLKLFWNDSYFKFFKTKGHSEGSICFSISNYLFTGDTLIKDEKTVTKLPGGSKDELALSNILLLNEFQTINPLVCSGHNDSFFFCESKLL